MLLPPPVALLCQDGVTDTKLEDMLFCGKKNEENAAESAGDSTSWVPALLLAFRGALGPLGVQKIPLVLDTGCSGTGAPSKALEARVGQIVPVLFRLCLPPISSSEPK